MGYIRREARYKRTINWTIEQNTANTLEKIMRKFWAKRDFFFNITIILKVCPNLEKNVHIFKKTTNISLNFLMIFLCRPYPLANIHEIISFFLCYKAKCTYIWLSQMFKIMDFKAPPLKRRKKCVHEYDLHCSTGPCLLCWTQVEDNNQNNQYTQEIPPSKSERNTFSCDFWDVPVHVGAMSGLTHIFNLNIGINL